MTNPNDRTDDRGALPRRQLGATGLQVTPLCFGTAPLGDMAQTYGYSVDEDEAAATLDAIFASGVNHLDTAAMYGDGRAEQRIGTAIAARGGLPDGFVIATKVDLDPTSGDFSASQVRRSVERSLTLLGLERLPIAYLHDPYRITFDEGTGPNGTLAGLQAVRDDGLVEHIGIAEGGVALAQRYVSTGEFEAMITHNRWTLVDRSAGPLIEDAHTRGMGITNAAVFGGGILVRGAAASDNRYAYHQAPEVVLERIRAMERACAEHGVPLPAAALRFSLRDPRVTSTIVGVSGPDQVTDALRWAEHPVPDDLWDTLLPLAAPEEHWQH